MAAARFRLLRKLLPAAPPADTLWAFDWERRAFDWVDHHRHPALDAVLIPASLLTEWGILWIFVLLVLFQRGDARQRKLAVQTGLTLLFASTGVVVPLMYLLPRQRPYLALPGVAALSLPLRTPSFPSAHAKSAALMAVVLGSRRPRRASGLAMFALLVSYARVYCGLHWPLDVLAGTALGVVSGSLLLRFREKAGAPEPVDP